MKREHHQLDPRPTVHSSSSGKGKMWEEEHSLQPDGGMDELLAVLGYNVRSSDMAEVALKLEQLEEVMGAAAQEDGFSDLASDTIHYDPSNLSTWLESMLSEFNPGTSLDPLAPPGATAVAVPPLPPLPFDDCSFVTPAESSTITSIDFPSCSSDYDLKAIPGKAMYSSNTHQAQIQTQSQTHFDSSSPSINSSARENKRLKTSPTDQFYPPIESTRPIILADSQDNGIRLVHALMACAEAVQQNNLNLAEAFVKQIRLLALSQAGAMGKVATFFAEALARRIYGFYPQNSIDHSLSDLLEIQFYETSPYLKFAHFTANQAILEAFEGKNSVHVIDFSMNQGMQWPALMQALALRPGGPPAFRLTGIGPPAPDNIDHLQQVGWKLAQLAETIHVKFEYRGFVANSLADLDASMLELRPSEVDAVAVNSVFELHKVLARPGAMDKVLSFVRNIKPDILTVVEQEANHNGPVFLDRFTESLHYYSTMFDSLEGSLSSPNQAMSEAYLGKQICNVVACEGVDRDERHEPLTQWRTRFSSAGFVPVHLGSNAFKQASMLLALFAGGEGYKVEENNGCLTLGWYTRPLIATSAWKLVSKPGVT